MPRTSGSDNRAWSTASEIEFIDKLDPKVLRQYAAGLQHRTRWDKLNEKEVKRAVERRLKSLDPPTTHRHILPSS